MGFSCGIVGLPNVGKSTLFNALTKTAAAQAANFPFCTIEPNVGRVAVPDPRLEQLATLVKPQKVVPTSLEFVDIAGLVAGASKGEGLGNQFLGNIREVDAIAHVIRCFEDDDITHVSGAVNPVSDIETIETELLLADVGAIEKRLAPIAKKATGGDKAARFEADLYSALIVHLSEGKAARLFQPQTGQETLLKSLNLITAKPVLYVANVAEEDAAKGNKHSAEVAAYATKQQAPHVVVSAAIEAEVALLEAEDQTEYLTSMGLEEPGLNRVIRAGYGLLDLITFFTAGEKEVRAWTAPAGSTAPQAAGRIHSDFERGFIRAETTAYADFVALGGEAGAKDAGKLRLEGKDYIVQDGDVMHFRFNV